MPVDLIAVFLISFLPLIPGALLAGIGAGSGFFPPPGLGDDLEVAALMRVAVPLVGLKLPVHLTFGQ